MGKRERMKTEMVLLGAAGAVIALVVVYTMMGTKKRDREEDDEPEVVKIAKLEVEVSHLADEAKANAVTIQEAVNKLPGDNPKLKAIAAKGVALATGT